MDSDYNFQPGDDIRNMGLEEMRRQKVLLASELKAIDAQISDLAFNNYGTYADAGRATHDCSKTFGEMRDKTVNLSGQADELTTAFQEFRSKAKKLAEEQDLVRKSLDKSNPIWELLTLPSRMDICIRAGYYDLAYTLTNYGMQLQQQSHLCKNPLIKKVADHLVEARAYLLEELFNKFAGPLDLAESIKVVNNVRKMPFLTANQLRIAVLQHRDIYLEKQILDISGNVDVIVQAIEIYRTSMYDTLVLYLAVFPENEIVRKNPNADPRWESWPVLPPNSILSQWVISNVKKMLDLIIKTDVKSAVDLSAVWTKLMAMASSFGRMGIDFRPLIAGKLTKLVEQRFRQNVQDATNHLTGSSREIVMIGIDPASLPQFEPSPDSPPVAAAEISLWDDMTVYTNDVVDALNSLRFILTPVILSTVVVCLRDSVRSILTWLATSHSSSANFTRAVRIVCTCVAPFFEKCVAFFFPPATVNKIFGSSISKQQYLQFIELDMKQLAASCDGAEKIEEIVKPLLQKKTLEEIGLDTVITAKPEISPAKFSLETTEEANEIPEAVEKDTRFDNEEKDHELETVTCEKQIDDLSGKASSTVNPKADDNTEKCSEDVLTEKVEEPFSIEDDSSQKPFEPRLEPIREHGDVIASEQHNSVRSELVLTSKEILTESTQEEKTDDAEEEDEGWGWGEEEESEEVARGTTSTANTDEIEVKKKKSGKDD
ncbi:hypothetical protein CAEBREN_07977 [Caenorhabditis brenneri]|uniref:Conserved oligomeric Golgi complex subunit 8 n=1 Tax=Caenorhabditis brenneri TaxID=135651 RepID=G0P9F8_CAEBE|nr:hypothetical protein CAEBREN_07977 [Caenorhabditis brenneri]